MLRGAGREPRPVRFAVDDGDQRVADCRAGKRRTPGTHLKEHAAECPDVGALVDRLPPRLLGRHVRSRSHDHAELRVVPVASRRLTVRPGGRLVAYVTHRATMERWRFVHSGFHRLFDRDELEQMLVDGGFARADVTIHEERVAGFARGLFAIARRS